MPAISIEERFALALHNAARIWRQELDRRLRHVGVGQAGWLAIAAIAKAKSALSQIELANTLGVEGPSLVSLIDRLVKAGLVERHPSEKDRRVNHVVLTEAGRELYVIVRSEASRYRLEVLSGVDRDRLLDVTQFLEALQSRIEEGL
jgi:MarR family transcriptional regulator for hemolysin